MSTAALVALVAPGLLLLAVMALAQAKLLRTPTPPAPDRWPPVSILKPMKGADPGLEANLTSFFRLDYPGYEVLLGVDRPDDPALEVARRVAAAHPDVPCRLIADRRAVGVNPKVNNLANLARHARHEVVWISDSNTRVAPGTLSDLVARLEQPGVGLVSSPFRGVGGTGLGGACEGLQLNTFVMGGVAALHGVLRGVCVVGKSMILRRSTLAALGGFAFLGRFLAEDQVCGEEVAALGLRVGVAGRPVENVIGPLSVRAFLSRHVRWATIRRRMNPAGYAAEVLLNPVFIAACGALALHSRSSLACLAAVLALKAAIDAASERAAGVRRRLVAYPALALAKDLMIGAAWIAPFFNSSVVWRGTRFHVGPRTVLVPQEAVGHALLGPTSAPAGS